MRYKYINLQDDIQVHSGSFTYRTKKIAACNGKKHSHFSASFTAGGDTSYYYILHYTASKESIRSRISFEKSS